MRIKPMDGPLQVVNNGNNRDILNSPKRLNTTTQYYNYTQNIHNSSTTYNYEINNISNRTQQLTIEQASRLGSLTNDNEELKWFNSNSTTATTTTGDQLNLPELTNYQQNQRHLTLNNLTNNQININNTNLATRLRLRCATQNAQHIFIKGCQQHQNQEQQMQQSPDDIPPDLEDESHQSCCSSVSVSPQDEENRLFELSDTQDSSDDGNDYSPTNETFPSIPATKLKSFVNPNYPGFQHLAHTLDFDDETLNNANNNNNNDEEFKIIDKFDSINRLDSIENIQKVFHDKSLEIDVPIVDFPLVGNVSTPNESCDSGSESGSGTTEGSSTSNDETINRISPQHQQFNISFEKNEDFNIVVEEKDAAAAAADATRQNKEDDSNENLKIASISNNLTGESVIGDFQKEVEDKLDKLQENEKFNTIDETNPDESTTTTTTIIEKQLENFNQNYCNLSKASTVEIPKSNVDVCLKQNPTESTTGIRIPVGQQEEKEEEIGKAKSITNSTILSQNLTVIAQIPSTNQIIQSREKVKVPSFLPLNRISPNTTTAVAAAAAAAAATAPTVTRIRSPMEHKMSDAVLTNCKENISKITLTKTTNFYGNSSKENHIKTTLPIRRERRDSNKELENIEIQIQKIKSDILCEMEKLKNDEGIQKPLLQTPLKMTTFVKKRRDYNQQFASLITFPKKETIKRNIQINRRSAPPIIKERPKTTKLDPTGGFDVYNIETAMPEIDLEAIETHLRAAKEAERKRWTDREEIRRRLAMGSEDDYYTDRPGRKPSLQSRLQSGMNLQICFMNETVSDNESQSSDSDDNSSHCHSNNKQLKTKQQNANINKKKNIISGNGGVATAPPQRPATLSLNPVPSSTLQLPSQLGGSGILNAETDFFTKQARLQTEARMALAQAKEMARMQMEIERQKQKKSPITEMVRHSLEKVGIPFPEEKRRLSRQILTDMNVAQLQVIVNDLHTQIEILNEQLVKFLMDRDDLHMEQDSKLVDIEDLTRYLGAKEQVFKDQKSTPTPQNYNNNNNVLQQPPPPPSPLATALSNTVRPHLSRIANLVKK